MTENATQASRLKELISALKITQSAFAQRLGVTRGYVSILISGEKPISQTILNGIANCYPKVNMNWLISGNAEMFQEKKDVAQEPESGVLTGVMEPEAVYARVRGLRVEELPQILLSLQAEVEELRRRVEELEGEVGRLKGG